MIYPGTGPVSTTSVSSVVSGVPGVAGGMMLAEGLASLGQQSAAYNAAHNGNMDKPVSDLYHQSQVECVKSRPPLIES